jgi:tape measure domain-containing protein
MATFEDIIIRVSSQGVQEVAQGLGAIGKQAQSTTGALAALNRIAYTLASAFSVKALADYADQYTNLGNQLKIVTKSSTELQQVQDRLFKTAQDSRTNVKSLADLYTSLSLSQKETGVSGERLHKVIGTISKTLTLSGTSSATAANALRQLVQGLQSGRLGGEELRSVLENTRYTAQTLAKGLGVPIGALREMGAQGQLTGKRVIEAFLKMSDSVDKDFSKTSITISQSLQLLDNAFLRFIGTTNETTGAANLVAAAIAGIAANLPAIVTGLALMTAGWVAYRVAVLTVAAAQWLANAAISASPMGLVLTVIAAVVAIMVTYSASVKGIIPLLKEWWDMAVGLYTWLRDGIKDIITVYDALTGAVSDSARSWAEAIKGFIDATQEWFVGWYEYFKELLTVKLPNAVSSGLTAIKKFFEDTWTSIKDYVTKMINRIMDSVKQLKDRVMSYLQPVIDMINRAASAGSSSSTTDSSGKVAGARASGGPVAANKQYLVGEEGPELFIPKQSGMIVPNGGSGELMSGGGSAANDNTMPMSKTIELIGEGVAHGMHRVVDLLTELIDLVKTSSSGSTGGLTKGDEGGYAAGEGYTALNNFGVPEKPEVTVPTTPVQDYMPSTPVVDNSNKNIQNTTNGEIDKFVREYAELLLKNWDTRGMDLTDKQREKNYLNAERYIANVPSGLQETVKQLANARLPRKDLGFRSGGAFSVTGGTGVDSKVIPIKASPGERVDIRTRKQVREEIGMASGKGDTYVNFYVTTKDADSFNKSKPQIHRDLLRTLMKDAS